LSDRLEKMIVHPVPLHVLWVLHTMHHSYEPSVSFVARNPNMTEIFNTVESPGCG
jgi:hypothetical protein